MRTDPIRSGFSRVGAWEIEQKQTKGTKSLPDFVSFVGFCKETDDRFAERGRRWGEGVDRFAAKGSVPSLFLNDKKSEN